MSKKWKVDNKTSSSYFNLVLTSVEFLALPLVIGHKKLLEELVMILTF